LANTTPLTNALRIAIVFVIASDPVGDRFSQDL
jgi:hypothetical protein